jgi:hypothetical protein
MNNMRDLPNTVGFQFIGITHDDDRINCVVVLRNNMCRSVEDEQGEPCFMRLAGWEPK